MDIIQMHLAFRLNLDKSGKLELPAFEPEEIDFWIYSAIVKLEKTRYTGSDKNLSFEETLKRSEDLKTLVQDAVITPSYSGNNTYIANLSTLVDKWFILGEEVEITYTKLGNSTTSSKRQGVTKCTIDTYRSKLDDPYSEHRLHYEEAQPLRLIYQNTVELISDGNYTITKYYLRYLKKPQRVNSLQTAYTSATANIEEGFNYIVSNGTLTYNGVLYQIGSTFTGVEGVRAFTGAGTATAVLANCDLPNHLHDEVIALATNMVLENIEQPRYQTQTNELNKIE
jgi:hypothetical protein